MKRRLALFTLACAAATALAQNDLDVPFVTTPDNVTLAMLRLARVGPRDHLIDLGSGDGRIPILAARRFGASALGVEIVPELVRQSRANAERAGVAQRVEFREQDLFATDLSRASVVTLYLMPEVNLKLRPSLLALEPGTRIVSHDWDMGEWAPDRTVTLAAPDKKIGIDKKSRVHLWVVPARVDGRWCGTGTARGTTLRLRQTFQRLHGELARADTKPISFDGRVDATRVRSQRGALELALRGDRLHASRTRGVFKPWRAAAFARCP
jgi:SAM-dependent methyltransferase